MKTKPIILLSCLSSGLLFGACSEPKTASQAPTPAAAIDGSSVQVSFSVINAAKEDFSQVPLVLSRSELSQLGLELSENTQRNEITLHVATESASTNSKLASQTDDLDGDGKWDELAFLIDVPGSSELSVNVSYTEASVEDNLNTNIRFAQYSNEEKSEAIELTALTRRAADLEEGYSRQFQMEGPAWENDNIGFRLYFDERNGFDIFGKTNTNMVLDGVGINENYHEMQDWGMDILKVGRSLGAGALAFVDTTAASPSLQRIANAEQSTVEILTEGPVRSILDVRYTQLPMPFTEQRNVNLTHRISIWAGQNYYSGELILADADVSGAIAVGIVNLHQLTASQNTMEDYAVLASYGAQAELGTNLGMAVVTNIQDHLGFGEVGATEAGVEFSFFSSLRLNVSDILKYDFYSVWQPRMQNIDSEKAFLELIKQDLMRKESVTIKAK